MLAIPVTWFPAAAFGVALAITALRAVRSLAARRRARATQASGTAIALGTDSRGRAVSIGLT
jgi:hypothetical protein